MERVREICREIGERFRCDLKFRPLSSLPLRSKLNSGTWGEISITSPLSKRHLKNNTFGQRDKLDFSCDFKATKTK